MSGMTHPATAVLRVRSHWLLVLATMLVVSAAVVGVIALSSGDSNSSSATVTPASQVGGPNEAARGNAAASAAGAPQAAQPGGPDETARGNSVAGAQPPLQPTPFPRLRP
jgi:hypothetical protein